MGLQVDLFACVVKMRLFDMVVSQALPNRAAARVIVTILADASVRLGCDSHV